jgi:hypothetical protein
LTTPPVPCATDALLRVALVCWSIDPSHGMTPAQHAWLTARLAAQTPLLPKERARLCAPLLAWCRQPGGEQLAAVIQHQYALEDSKAEGAPS